MRTKRKEAGFTAEVLAQMAGVDRTYITKIEKHNKLPTLAIMRVICDKLYDAEDLFRDYLKIKYPAQYEKLEKEKAAREIGYLGREFNEIKKVVEKVNKEGISPKELSNLKKRILFFGNDVNRSVTRLQYYMDELRKIKKITSKLRK